MGFFPSPYQCYDIIIALLFIYLLIKLVSHVSVVVHGPLVLKQF